MCRYPLGEALLQVLHPVSLSAKQSNGFDHRSSVLSPSFQMSVMIVEAIITMLAQRRTRVR